MGEAVERRRAIRRTTRTFAIALVLSLVAALVHHSVNDASTRSDAITSFLARVRRDVSRAGFRVERRETRAGIERVRVEIPSGSCYVLAVGWTGRVAPDHDVRMGCAPSGARIASRMPRWSSWTIEALDPAGASTHYELYLGRIADGFDPVAAMASGIPLDPDELTLGAAAMQASLLALPDRTALLRATIPTDAAVAVPVAPSTLAAIDAASDLRPGRGPCAVVSPQSIAVGDDPILRRLGIHRRADARLKRSPADRRALAVVDASLVVPDGCFTLGFRFAGVRSAPPVMAHHVGAGVETPLERHDASAEDVLCSGDPVTIYSVDAAVEHQVILEVSAGASHRAPVPPLPATRSLDDVRAWLRGDGRPRDPWAALRTLDAIGESGGTPAERMDLRVEALTRLVRSEAETNGLAGTLAQGCEGGDGFLCALRGDALRSGYGMPRDVELARASFVRACALGHSASCALAERTASELGVSVD